MANVVISGDTSGAITLSAPAVAGTNTLTLPATTGTLVVTSGAQTIEFADGTVSAPSITNSGDTNTGIFFPAADTIAFTEGGVESVRIDSSARLLLGNTASNNLPYIGTQFAPGFQNYATSGTGGFYRYSANSDPCVLTFAKSRNATIGSQTIVNNGDNLGYIGFAGSDGTNFITAASIVGMVDGVPGTNDMPGRLLFTTTADGASSPTERMRITSGGLVGIGTSSPSALLQVAGSSIFQDSVQIFNNPTSSAQGILFRNTFNVGGSIFSMGAATTNDIILWVGGSGTQGAITGNGAGINYSSNSDYRLKENVAPMTGALAKVSQLKPCTYIWKFDGSEGQGFIAHELQEVFPDAVTGKKDDVETYTDEDGNEQTKIKPQGVDTSFLVATLTAALQELKAIVDTQATKIAELEAKLEGTA